MTVTCGGLAVGAGATGWGAEAYAEAKVRAAGARRSDRRLWVDDVQVQGFLLLVELVDEVHDGLGLAAATTG